MEKFEILFNNFLHQWNLNESTINSLYIIINLIAILLVSILANWIVKKIILKLIQHFVKKSKASWDDIILERKVFNRLSQLAPAIIVYYTINIALPNSPGWVGLIQSLSYVYMVIIGMLVLDSFISALHEIYNTNPISKDRPIKGYIQVVQIVIYFFGVILILGVILGKSPLSLLAGLGAMAAVLMLVFKDSILGLVAGIQLTLNKMVKIGDWITMPKYNADGNIIEITLNTVKVRNFDMTITTIPTYSLVSDSFSNWRGMEESGGRRIKRAINIDISSIHFCSEELLSKLEKIEAISEYIKSRRKEIEEYNNNLTFDRTVTANGRRLTNIGIFRRYIEEYLSRHPQINKNMTFLIRQLTPSEKGLPIEIYVFSKEQRWVYYEGIQADIFDHLLAAIQEFELKVFQNPSGYDFQKLINN